MDVAVVNARVDYALADNRRAEWILIGMAVGIFVLGVAILVVAWWAKNPYVAGASTLTQGFLVFPIREIRKLRRDNLILQTFPVLIHELSPGEAAREVTRLLTYLRSPQK